jgi:uncharacterized membrane protein
MTVKEYFEGKFGIVKFVWICIVAVASVLIFTAPSIAYWLYLAICIAHILICPLIANHFRKRRLYG